MPAQDVHGDKRHIGSIDLNKFELKNPVLQNLGADIGTPTNGLFFYRSDTHRMRVRANGAWQDVAWSSEVGASGIQPSIIDAKGDIIVGTADNTVARKAAGANGTALFANSAQGDGLEWRAIVAADLADFVATARAAISVSDTATIDLSYAGGVLSGIIIDDSVDNTKAANMAQATIKGRASGAGTGDPTDLTAAQVKTILALVAADISNFDTAVRTSRLDQMAAPTAAVSMNSQKITNLADGTAANDAINLAQLQAAIEGRQLKDTVDAATTGALPAVTYNNGAGTLTASANGALAAQDGVTLAVGDSLLVKNQASGFQNGIYTVTQVGSGGTPFILTRRADANTAAELTDASTLVDAGTTLKGKIYTFPAITTLGTTDATPVITGDITVYTGSSTITLTGTAFSVTANSISETHLTASVAGNGLVGGNGTPLAVNPGAGIEISGDAVRIAASAGGAGLVGGGGAALAVGQGTGIIVNADDVAIDTALVSRLKVGALTGGSNSEVITHSLGTRDITKVTVRNPNSPWDEIDVAYQEATTTNTVTIYAAAGQNLPAGYRWRVST